LLPARSVFTLIIQKMADSARWSNFFHRVVSHLTEPILGPRRSPNAGRIREKNTRNQQMDNGFEWIAQRGWKQAHSADKNLEKTLDTAGTSDTMSYGNRRILNLGSCKAPD
jgi:hypothetical protein